VPWCTSKNSVAVIDAWIHNGVDECSQRVGVQRPPDTTQLTKSVVAARADTGHVMIQTQIGKDVNRDFSAPLRGLTPYFLRTPPNQFELVTPNGGQVLDRCPIKKSEKSGVPKFAMSPTFVGHLHKMLDCLRKVLFRPICENSLAHLWLLIIVQLLQ